MSLSMLEKILFGVQRINDNIIHISKKMDDLIAEMDRIEKQDDEQSDSASCKVVGNE